MIPIDLYFQGLESAKKRSGGTWRIQSMCQSQWKWVSHTVFTCFYPVGNNNFLHNIGDIWWYLWDNRCKYYLDTETRPQVSKGWILQTILTKTKPPKGVLRILWHWAQHIHVFGVTTKVAWESPTWLHGPQKILAMDYSYGSSNQRVGFR